MIWREIIKAPIKEIIGSKKSLGTLFPKRLVVNDLEFFEKKKLGKF